VESPLLTFAAHIKSFLHIWYILQVQDASFIVYDITGHKFLPTINYYNNMKHGLHSKLQFRN